MENMTVTQLVNALLLARAHLLELAVACANACPE